MCKLKLLYVAGTIPTTTCAAHLEIKDSACFKHTNDPSTAKATKNDK